MPASQDIRVAALQQARGALIFTKSVAMAEYERLPNLDHYLVNERKPSTLAMLNARPAFAAAFAYELGLLAGEVDHVSRDPTTRDPARQSAGAKLRAARAALLNAWPSASGHTVEIVTGGHARPLVFCNPDHRRGTGPAPGNAESRSLTMAEVGAAVKMGDLLAPVTCARCGRLLYPMSR